ncbi:MAG: hypothetical protein E7480_00245 [Ruminococcaceae bacterium]|nr:hypothetical protein [Oscillospiraceae bacterium]
MKKFLCFIIVFVLVSSLNVYAQEENELTIHADSSQEFISRAKNFIYSQMDNLCTKTTVIFTGKGLEEFTYDQLLKGQTGLESEIITEYMQTEGKDYNALILRQYSISKTVWKNSSSNGKPSKLRIIYSFRWDEEMSDIQKLESFSKSVIEKLSQKNKTQYEMVKAIHDFVVSEYSYDTSSENEIHNPSDLIEQSKGVCSAYTGLIYKLLQEAGIESRIILLDAKGLNGAQNEAHTWNLIKLDNLWYHMDATWDDPITILDSGKIRYDYFLKSDETILKDHSFNKKPYPSALEDYKEKTQSLPIINIVPQKIDTSKTIPLNELKLKTQTSLLNSFLLFFPPSAFIGFFCVIFLIAMALFLLKLFEQR